MLRYQSLSNRPRGHGVMSFDESLYRYRLQRREALDEASDAATTQQQRRARFFAPLYDLVQSLHVNRVCFPAGAVASADYYRRCAQAAVIGDRITILIDARKRLILDVQRHNRAGGGITYVYVGTVMGGPLEVTTQCTSRNIHHLAEWLAGVVAAYEIPPPQPSAPAPTTDEDGRTLRAIDLTGGGDARPIKETE